jgi:crotonobetainyl-CoA:carnitine CoA-transferase CaiB-like acyl-CoA transferase
LIYCHNAGYGSKGPRALEPTMEYLHSALAGILHVTAGRGNPPILYLSNMDITCGLNGALTIILALYERAISGQGQYVEAPQNGVSMLCTSDVHFRHGKKSRYLDLDEQQFGHGPLNALYPTAEGWLCLSCRPQREWEALCQATGLKDLPSELRIAAGAVTEQNWVSALEREVADALNRGESGLMTVLGPQFEKALITRALAHTGGRRIEAANLLGFGRNTLTRKIQELGLDAEKNSGDA